jgi:hypothetical protein
MKTPGCESYVKIIRAMMADNIVFLSVDASDIRHFGLLSEKPKE